MAEHVIFENADLKVRIDYSKRKQVLRDDFDNYFERKINENSRLTRVEIYHSYSHAWSGLQFAYILAWSMFQEVEHKNSEYMEILTIGKQIYPVWNLNSLTEPIRTLYERVNASCLIGFTRIVYYSPNFINT